MRSYNGCWTCRLRRKKCDERRPICHECKALHIDCNYSSEKPEWMDGGARQQEQAARIKRQIKHNAHLRRSGAPVEEPSEFNTAGPSQLELGDLTIQETQLPEQERSPNDLPVLGISKLHDLKSSDTVLVLYYLEKVLPFLFPFYRPSILQGGKAWILELMIKSPVVRKALLCQSAYFLYSSERLAVCDTTARQTSEAFNVLRQALQVMQGSDCRDHIHGATRIFASIMQVQRFEIAVSSFASCQAHLNAALALFRQILESTGLTDASPESAFDGVLESLGPSSWTLPAQCDPMPNSEQSAFRFSTALLLFDDVIASTVLRKRPQLLNLHRKLLNDNSKGQPVVNLLDVMGCQNWAISQIGKIAVLAAWKHECLSSGGLYDDDELAQHTTSIKQTLARQLAEFENEQEELSVDDDALNCLHTGSENCRDTLAFSRYLVTKIWAHAAFLYLSVTSSGMHSMDLDIRDHVGEIISLLKSPKLSPAHLRTMVWPMCIAGCLAKPEQEAHFRTMAENLRPHKLFPTIRKALEIMQKSWQERGFGSQERDLAYYLHSDEDLVLLV